MVNITIHNKRYSVLDCKKIYRFHYYTMTKHNKFKALELKLLEISSKHFMPPPSGKKKDKVWGVCQPVFQPIYILLGPGFPNYKMKYNRKIYDLRNEWEVEKVYGIITTDLALEGLN